MCTVSKIKFQFGDRKLSGWPSHFTTFKIINAMKHLVLENYRNTSKKISKRLWNCVCDYQAGLYTPTVFENEVIVLFCDGL